MKSHYLALVSALSLAIASPAVAASTAGLTIGGNTIAGPGTTTLAPSLAATVYTNDAGNTDTCTTVFNIGRGAVRVTMTGNGAGTIDLDAGATGALCRNDTAQIEILCLGVAPNSCKAQWRVDRD
jgi:hypothetical protein